MAWLFGTAGAGTTAGGAGAASGSAASAAAAGGAAGGIGAGLTTIGGTGTFGGLGAGGSGAALTGVGAGTPSLAASLGMSGASLAPYGAGTLGAALGGTASPSLLTGAGSLYGGSLGTSPMLQAMQPSPYRRVADAVLQPGQQDIIDGLLTGLTLSAPPAGPAGGGERGVQPQQLPGQVGAMPSQQNRGRMGFNANGILSWLPQTPQVPQAPQIPGQLPPVGMMKG